MLNFEIRKKYFSFLVKKISDVYKIITGIPPLSLPDSKGKNLKSYSISGNVDEKIIEYSDGTAIEGKPNLLRTAGRTEQAVSGNAQTKRILQGDKWAKLTANNNVGSPQSVTLGNGSVSFSTLTGGHDVGFPVKLKPNHSYTAYSNVSATTTTATMNIRISFYEADGTWISTWYQGNATNNGMTLKSFTVPSNADMTVIVCAKNNTESGTAPTITFSNIMIVEGVYTTSNAPAYTPYKQLLTDVNGVGDYDSAINKYKIPVLSSGKNLLSGTLSYNATGLTGTSNNIFITPKPEISLTGSTSFEKGTIGGDGSYGSDKTRIRTKEFIPVDNNTNYILSNPAIACTTYIFLYSSADDTGYIKRLPGWASLPYAFNTESASYIKIIFKKDDGTTFEPSEIGTVVVKPIANVQLTNAGENSDKINYPQNTITRMIGKFIFTGNENIDMYDNQHGFRFLITGMQSGMCIDGFCNRFENFKNVTDNNVPRVFFGYNNNYVYFRRVTSTSVTKAGMQAILANWYSSGKPLTIWYPLEEEAEEAVTLPDIPTVRGNATIMIDTEVQPSEISAEYAVEEA